MANPCTSVAKGGVGESGGSSLVHHVAGSPAKLMVLSTTGTNLCSNTGAIAVLVIDGQPAAQGAITDAGSSIQAEAAPGANVIGIVHTVPLFNGKMCVMLGELEFDLEECDLVE